jgi:colanic acid/amylovoran biosynthesis glycosyltransferase
VNLILFTTSYPYVQGGEQNFLEEEIKYLAEAFDRVIVVPEIHGEKGGERFSGIEVEDSYADYLSSHGRISRFFLGLLSTLVYKEIITRPSILLKPAYLRSLFFFAGQSEITRRWVVGWIRMQNIAARDCLFYTYWFDQAAMGIGLAKRFFSDLKLVSRAHGYDIYEERRTPPYWPCRESALGTVDFLFPDSDSGTEYLRNKYPEFVSCMETARLGIPDSGILTKASSDGVYRIVSCSRMVEVKRLDLMMHGIAAAANRQPAQRFEWCHFGTGPLQLELEKMTKELPENVVVRFAGYSTQPDLFKYYRENPVDVFMNVSISEGTSVAIMEAISCGIPIIATGVGGNKEIVSDKNGLLLPANPTPHEIADALLHHWDAPDDRRAGSRVIWAEQYDSRRNFSAFTQRLVNIRRGSARID